MKKIHEKRLKTTALALAFLVMFQGCVVYHKTPTTLEQAIREHVETKITTSEQETTNYDYISFKGDTIYGVNKTKGELVRTALVEEEIEKVLTKNRSASTWLTAIAVAVPILPIVVLGFGSSGARGVSYGWGGGI